jgi:hypothetical protein
MPFRFGVAGSALVGRGALGLIDDKRRCPYELHWSAHLNTKIARQLVNCQTNNKI